MEENAIQRPPSHRMLLPARREASLVPPGTAHAVVRAYCADSSMMALGCPLALPGKLTTPRHDVYSGEQRNSHLPASLETGRAELAFRAPELGPGCVALRRGRQSDQHWCSLGWCRVRCGYCSSGFEDHHSQMTGRKTPGQKKGRAGTAHSHPAVRVSCGATRSEAHSVS